MMDARRLRENLWDTYIGKGSDTAYRELISSYLPLVRYIVSRMHFKLPNHLEQEDLISFGVFGLMEAVRKYDPNRGVKFETYASQRIRGSVLDALRKEQWAPRSVTDKLKELQRVYRKLEGDSEGEISDSLLAREMGMEVNDLRSLFSEINQLSVTSLEDFLQGNDFERLCVGDTLADPNSPNPLSKILDREFKEYLVQAIEDLPEKDKLVISLYYYEELTLREIGRVLEVSESRVSQLHARALMRLRAKLEKYMASGEVGV